MKKTIGVLGLGVSSNLYPRKAEEQGRLSKKTTERRSVGSYGARDGRTTESLEPLESAEISHP